jgi:hypothetical protein
MWQAQREFYINEHQHAKTRIPTSQAASFMLIPKLKVCIKLSNKQRPALFFCAIVPGKRKPVVNQQLILRG